jgi:hypothetical protein
MKRHAAITASRNALLATVALMALSTAAMADPLIDGESTAGFSTDDTLTMYNTMNNQQVTSSYSSNLYLNSDSNGDISFSLNLPEDYGNNGYGTTSQCGSSFGGSCGTDPAYNWAKEATLEDRLGSDGATFTFYDSKGNDVLSFFFDYASWNGTMGKGSNTYTAIGTCGDLVGSACGYSNENDAKLTTGTASWLNKYATSLSYDFTSAGGGSLTNNANGGNSPKPGDSNASTWINQLIYQGEISKAAFGSNGFGGVSVDLVHVSPSENGIDQEYALCANGTGVKVVNPNTGQLQATCGLNPQMTQAPEPGTLSLLGGGLLGLGFFRRFRRRRS